MSLKYIKSEKGANILVDSGYMYQRECIISQEIAFGGVCNTNKNVEKEFIFLTVK